MGKGIGMKVLTASCNRLGNRSSNQDRCLVLERSDRVLVAVAVGVLVAVAVGVLVAVAVGVLVAVAVGVLIAVAVGVLIAVAVGVLVGETAVAVFVGAGVSVGRTTISGGTVGVGCVLPQATKIDMKNTPNNTNFAFVICFSPIAGNKLI